MRCNSCNKFVSFDEPEVEVEDADIERTDETTVHVTAEIIIRLNCAECGDALKETTISYEGDFEVPLAVGSEAGTDDTLDVVILSEPYDRYSTTDRHGKPIKNPRYQTHYYGVNLAIAVDADGAHYEFDDTVEAAASEFDEVA